MSERRSKEGPRPARFTVESHELVHEGFFRVESLKVHHQAFGPDDRTIVPPAPLEVVNRGDAVAAILYDPRRREVVLVDQFRLPTSALFRRPWDSDQPFQPRLGEQTGGWLLETVAGSLRKAGESPEACVRREIEEETGYRVSETRRIAEYFSSPGGTSELVHLFYAEVVEGQRESAGGGLEAAGEDIDIVGLPIEEFLDRLERQEFRDPKIIIGGYWLRDHLARVSLEVNDHSRTVAFELARAAGRGAPRLIGFKTGDIKNIRGVDVWVNPENTYMMMDRPFGRSVSAAIRWAGAEREPGKQGQGRGERILRDTIADDLKRKLGGRNHVGIGDIVETVPGRLKDQGVKSILHVAIAEGFHEEGLRSDVRTLTRCLHDVLVIAERANRWRTKHRSILVPLIGTGTSGVPLREVAPALVRVAAEFLESRPASGLREIYFVAYSMADREHLLKEMRAMVETNRLKPCAPTAGG